MAVNVQASTLCLTLPISCQICLGKVRQPVICANHHVFCSCCMEMWLKKANQCPTCRVPITAENPCREIIGGTNESDHSPSPTTRKCLRKTRGELLFREYEEEIEGLIRENEDLKSRNQSLELQLKTALDPSTIQSVATDDGRVDPSILEEWTNKLRAASDVCDKVKQDMEKLKEANKALRSQNIDLVQENMRLKAEVASRSPQKFGRYTVAALESKIQQYEREVDHLKRALERSDQYVEDLEARLRKSDKRPVEIQETCATGKAGADALTQQQKINMMMRSLSDNERGSICSNPEVECRTFSQNPSEMFASSTEQKEFNKTVTAIQKGEDSPSDFLPTTPSSAFRSLTLRSPGVREKRVAFKPASYLRRLDFDEALGSQKSGSVTANQLSSDDKFPKDSPSNTDTGPIKSVFWGPWQSSKSDDRSLAGLSSDSLVTVSATPGVDESSEASMDAAYLDKISELDSMMLDGDGSSSRGSQLSLASSSPANLDNTLVPEAHTSTDGKRVAEHDQYPVCDLISGSKAPRSLGGDGKEGEQAEEGEEGVLGTPAEELSFDLLFDPLEENQASPCGSRSPPGQRQPLATPPSSSSSSSCTGKPVNTPRDRHTLNTGQPTKRKSHSPFNTSSPTKLSKLM